MDLRNNSVVYRKNGKDRSSRGFSRKELGKAGISINQALRRGLPVDRRRRTIHESNVKLIQKQLGKFTSKTKKASSKKKSG